MCWGIPEGRHTHAQRRGQRFSSRPLPVPRVLHPRDRPPKIQDKHDHRSSGNIILVKLVEKSRQATQQAIGRQTIFFFEFSRRAHVPFRDRGSVLCQDETTTNRHVFTPAGGGPFLPKREETTPAADIRQRNSFEGVGSGGRRPRHGFTNPILARNP